MAVVTEMLKILAVHEAMVGCDGDNMTITQLCDPMGSEYFCFTDTGPNLERRHVIYKSPDVNPIIYELIDIMKRFNPYTDVANMTMYLPHLHLKSRPCALVPVETDQLEDLVGKNFDMDDIPVVTQDTDIPSQDYYRSIILKVNGQAW